MRKYFKLTCALLLSATMFTSVNAQTVNLNSGLIANWTFDDSTAKDVSGNGHNGTLKGKPTFKTGKKGACISLDGKADFVLVKHDTALNVGMSKSKSFSVWFQTPTKDVFNSGGFRIRPLFTKESGSSSKTDYLLMVEDQNDGNGAFIKYGTGVSSNSAAWMLVKEPKMGDWHHIVCTIHPNKVGSTTYYVKEVYLDTILVKKDSSSVKNANNTTDFAIGAAYNDNAMASTYFLGNIDEVKIYNRVLNKEEVVELFKPKVTSLEIENEIVSSFSLYPNPANNFLNISNSSLIAYPSRVLTVEGKVVQELSIQTGNNTIDISRLPKGLYYLNANNTFIKFIKQ